MFDVCLQILINVKCVNRHIHLNCVRHGFVVLQYLNKNKQEKYLIDNFTCWIFVVHVCLTKTFLIMVIKLFNFIIFKVAFIYVKKLIYLEVGKLERWFLGRLVRWDINCTRNRVGSSFMQTMDCWKGWWVIDSFIINKWLNLLPY